MLKKIQQMFIGNVFKPVSSVEIVVLITHQPHGKATPIIDDYCLFHVHYHNIALEDPEFNPSQLYLSSYMWSKKIFEKILLKVNC